MADQMWETPHCPQLPAVTLPPSLCLLITQVLEERLESPLMFLKQGLSKCQGWTDWAGLGWADQAPRLTTHSTMGSRVTGPGLAAGTGLQLHSARGADGSGGWGRGRWAPEQAPPPACPADPPLVCQGLLRPATGPRGA